MLCKGKIREQRIARQAQHQKPWRDETTRLNLRLSAKHSLNPARLSLITSNRNDHPRFTSNLQQPRGLPQNGGPRSAPWIDYIEVIQLFEKVHLNSW